MGCCVSLFCAYLCVLGAVIFFKVMLSAGISGGQPLPPRPEEYACTNVTADTLANRNMTGHTSVTVGFVFKVRIDYFIHWYDDFKGYSTACIWHNDHIMGYSHTSWQVDPFDERTCQSQPNYKQCMMTPLLQENFKNYDVDVVYYPANSTNHDRYKTQSDMVGWKFTGKTRSNGPIASYTHLHQSVPITMRGLAYPEEDRPMPKNCDALWHYPLPEEWPGPDWSYAPTAAPTTSKHKSHHHGTMWPTSQPTQAPTEGTVRDHMRERWRHRQDHASEDFEGDQP